MTMDLCDQAVQLARRLQSRAIELQTPQERRQQAELDRLIQNPSDKATLTQLTDQAFRSRKARRAADQVNHIFDAQGIPRFFSPMQRALLKGFQSFGRFLPGVAVPLVKETMRDETANVILPAEREHLAKHLAARRLEAVRMNLNLLGEALLGEEEAESRMARYLEALTRPEVEVLSVKISTIYSQISPLARRHTIAVLCSRLKKLFLDAASEQFQRTDGSEVPKFVYLDMEEYRDMSLTSEAFMQTLDRPGLEHVTAGIVLQAYIPDSFAALKRLCEWARRRVASGGAPITIRIVKGANMEMERVEASLHSWPQAPFQTKPETDANYKRMLRECFNHTNHVAVRVGIASHNLFELAYGLVLAKERNALDRCQIEMLEGMANAQRRAVFEEYQQMLLYAPACLRKEFIHAIGYLIRRLDENTGPDNFLRHAFKLDVGSDDWNRLEQSFRDSFDLIESLPQSPRRTQDRRNESPAVRPTSSSLDEFRNEPDTDFSLPHNSEWAEQIIADWLPQAEAHATEIPLIIAGREEWEERPTRESHDPSRPGTVVARYRQATVDDVNAAVDCAQTDPDGWRRCSHQERREILRQAAKEIRTARSRLIGAALLDGGKTISESDPEVSEAVDFVEFYADSAEMIRTLPGLEIQGQGAVVVVSPWNFPIAIPCGGVAAALAAGNNVILKPASDTVLPAWELVQCFYRAGVPQTALQFAPCTGGDVGAHLVAHPQVNTVILTGGTETALTMLSARPEMNLLAETGGKNATVVTALADRDQAINHVLHSAFSHSGQKCSATSLLILEREVYEDRNFRRVLCDAVQSLQVGPAYELHTRVGPLIRPPSGVLLRGLTELLEGEEWAVEPKPDEANPHLWSPGVKWGVEPNTFTHQTEFFGPVLGVMMARDLDEAIHFVNSTGYGLTSGIESLDDREQEIWTESVRAGNLYVNRGTTGAIVLRQPFGGMGKSAFGPGIKAGGPNYVAQLCEFEEFEPSDPIDTDSQAWDPLIADLIDRLSDFSGEQIDAHELKSLQIAVASYTHWAQREFLCEHDHFRLIGQDNIRRYLPVRELRVRVDARDSLFDFYARVCAARSVGCRVTVSYPEDSERPDIELLEELTDSWAGAIEFVEESDDDLANVIRERETERVRYAGAARVPHIVREAAAPVQLYVADAPVRRHGRIELLWYLQEQSVSVDYHRYGNLGTRAGEVRADTI